MNSLARTEFCKNIICDTSSLFRGSSATTSFTPLLQGSTCLRGDSTADDAFCVHCLALLLALAPLNKQTIIEFVYTTKAKFRNKLRVDHLRLPNTCLSVNKIPDCFPVDRSLSLR